MNNEIQGVWKRSLKRSIISQKKRDDYQQRLEEIRLELKYWFAALKKAAQKSEKQGVLNNFKKIIYYRRELLYLELDNFPINSNDVDNILAKYFSDLIGLSIRMNALINDDGKNAKESE